MVHRFMFERSLKFQDMQWSIGYFEVNGKGYDNVYYPFCELFKILLSISIVIALFPVNSL